MPAPATPGGARRSVPCAPSIPLTSLEAVLRPVRSGNTFEEAVQRILQAIKLGAVTEGDRLPPERELARRLRVSRVTLREALRALIDAGYVESRRGRSGGTFVIYCPDEHEPGELENVAAGHGGGVDDALLLRAVIEPGTAELAAHGPLESSGRRHLEGRLADVSRTRTRQAHRLADARLHLAIAEVTGSHQLVTAVADVQMSLADLLAAIPVLPVNIAHSHEQHAAVVEAILTGRPDTARERMRDHVEATAALLHGFLD